MAAHSTSKVQPSCLTHVSMAIESDCWLHPLRLCIALLWPSKMLFHQLLSMLMLRVPMPAAGICQQRHWWSLNGAQTYDHVLCKMKQSNAWGIMSACCCQRSHIHDASSEHACMSLLQVELSQANGGHDSSVQCMTVDQQYLYSADWHGNIKVGQTASLYRIAVLMQPCNSRAC